MCQRLKSPRAAGEPARESAGHETIVSTFLRTTAVSPPGDGPHGESNLVNAPIYSAAQHKKGPPPVASDRSELLERETERRVIIEEVHMCCANRFFFPANPFCATGRLGVV